MSLEKMFEQHARDDKEQFDEINKKLDMLIEAHNKQKGFIAGFSAAFSMLIATVIGLVIYVWRQVTGT